MTPGERVKVALNLHEMACEMARAGIRQRQRGDIAGVVAVQKNQLDEDYLRHWAGKLGVVEGLEAALSGQWQPQQT
jgi:hypothetical protein